MNQFKKRKQKEQETSVDTQQVEQAVEDVQLNERAYDVIDVNGRPNIVIIQYDVKTMQAKIESIQLVNKSIAMPFKNKKKALQTLIRDLYKLEK
jgi:hypothetical protein